MSFTCIEETRLRFVTSLVLSICLPPRRACSRVLRLGGTKRTFNFAFITKQILPSTKKFEGHRPQMPVVTRLPQDPRPQ